MASKTKILWAVSGDIYGIPGDCLVYSSEKGLLRDAPSDLDLQPGHNLYMAKLTIGPRTKFTVEKKTVTKLVKLELSEDDLEADG